MKTVELGAERSLHAVIEGEGPDLVLLHGALATSHDWLSGPAWDGLVRAGFRVTAVDRPGHGRSRRPRYEGVPRDQARQIRAGLLALGIEEPTLVGHSFGGLVSLAFAELFPAEVGELVLVAPIAFPEPRPLEHLLLAPRATPLLGRFVSLAAAATFDPPVLKLVQKLMWSPEDVPSWWEASFPYDDVLSTGSLVREGEDMAAILPLSPSGLLDLAGIRTPTRIIGGDSDKIVQHGRQGRLAAALMPNAGYAQVQGACHMVHHTHAELILEAVRGPVAA
jgi:pimeloyl-ACP methyl ester carboxylesterase